MGMSLSTEVYRSRLEQPTRWTRQIARVIDLVSLGPRSRKRGRALHCLEADTWTSNTKFWKTHTRHWDSLGAWNEDDALGMDAQLRRGTLPDYQLLIILYFEMNTKYRLGPYWLCPEFSQI